MLKKIYVFDYKLELVTGLFIGGNDNGFDIGGNSLIANPVIVLELTPFIIT